MKNGRVTKEADGGHYGIRELKRDRPHLLSDVARERAHLAKLPRARACRCEQPWTERDEEEDLRCVQCGRGIR